MPQNQRFYWHQCGDLCYKSLTPQDNKITIAESFRKWLDHIQDLMFPQLHYSSSESLFLTRASADDEPAATDVDWKQGTAGAVDCRVGVPEVDCCIQEGSGAGFGFVAVGKGRAIGGCSGGRQVDGGGIESW